MNGRIDNVPQPSPSSPVSQVDEVDASHIVVSSSDVLDSGEKKSVQNEPKQAVTTDGTTTAHRIDTGKNQMSEMMKKSKLFFTTSELMERMNRTMASVFNDGVDDFSEDGSNQQHTGGGFQPRVELQRRMPDGSLRRADDTDLAVADLQAKLRQAAQTVSTLSPEQRLQWSHEQRQIGNSLFGSGEYHEAMDVYLTCLVAMDMREGGEGEEILDEKVARTGYEGGRDCNVIITKTETHEGDSTRNQQKLISKERIEQEIKLPVLLNLSLCSLKLGMYKKTEQFCNFALGTCCLSASTKRDVAKIYFRRGKARMLMGSYNKAQKDLYQAMHMLQNSSTEAEVALSSVIDLEKKEISKEMDAVHKEMRKLAILKKEGERNRKRHVKAMKRTLGGMDTERLDDKHGEEKEGAIQRIQGSSTKGSRHKAFIGASLNVKVPSSSMVESHTDNDSRHDSVGNSAFGEGLYHDVRQRRAFSTLTAKGDVDTKRDRQHRYLNSAVAHLKKTDESNKGEKEEEEDEQELNCFQIYLSMVVRCLEKTLRLLGDESEGELGDTVWRREGEVVEKVQNGVVKKAA